MSTLLGSPSSFRSSLHSCCSPRLPRQSLLSLPLSSAASLAVDQQIILRLAARSYPIKAAFSPGLRLFLGRGWDEALPWPGNGPRKREPAAETLNTLARA